MNDALLNAFMQYSSAYIECNPNLILCSLCLISCPTLSHPHPISFSHV